MLTRERLVLFFFALVVAFVVAFFVLTDETDAPEAPIGGPSASFIARHVDL